MDQSAFIEMKIDTAKRANSMYRAGRPIMSDDEYDELVEELISLNVTNINELLLDDSTELSVERKKVNLPIHMGSMDKFKPEDEPRLEAWKHQYQGDYTISDKLDGCSALLHYINGAAFLYTRGDGSVGEDITHLIPYLNIPVEGGGMYRGELVMRKDKFAEKYADSYANARNLVAGVINAKTPEVGIIMDIDFVIFDDIEYDASSNTITRVWHCHSDEDNPLTVDNLTDILVKRKNESPYEIDGLIVSHNGNHELPKTGNPKYAFAFKKTMDTDYATTTVTEVMWNVSKHGLLKPRVQFDTVHLDGVDISYATGFNAKFIYDNGVGRGAKIKVCRSGGVIPYIHRVITPVPVPPPPPSKWSPSGVDLITDDSSRSKVAKMSHFFSTLGVKGFADSTAAKFVNAGYSIPDVVAMDYEEMMKIDGFAKKGSLNLTSLITKMTKDVPLERLLAAFTVVSGFGERMWTPVIRKFPDILEWSVYGAEEIEKIKTVEGYAERSAIKLVDALESYQSLVKELEGLGVTWVIHESSEYDGLLNGKSIVFTGFRDKILGESIQSMGGTVSGSISGNTKLVIAKDVNTNSSKARAARNRGIPVIGYNDIVIDVSDINAVKDMLSVYITFNTL